MDGTVPTACDDTRQPRDYAEQIKASSCQVPCPGFKSARPARMYSVPDELKVHSQFVAQQHLVDRQCRRAKLILRELAQSGWVDRRFAGARYRPGTAFEYAPMQLLKANQQLNRWR